MKSKIGTVKYDKFRPDPMPAFGGAVGGSKPPKTYIGTEPIPSPTPDDSDKFAFKSGATSSRHYDQLFIMPGESLPLTAARFGYGNAKHENSTPIYSEANWLKAFHARDVEFFRERATHAVHHLWSELRGNDDHDPGGNLGAVGWFVEVFAFVRKHDPDLYAAIQGLMALDSSCSRPCFCPLCESQRN
jgi:hypothetical protein